MASSINASTTAGVVTTADTSGVLNIQTAGTTAIAIDASQAVTMAGRTTNPTTISVGAATPSTSGAGITFPATQSASTNANTLDDYEEGTFTPSLSFGDGVVGLTYGYRVGIYVKVGNVVSVFIRIALNNKGSSTGHAGVSGLPFTANGTTDAYQVAYVGLIADMSGLTSNPFGQISPNASSFYFYQITSSNYATLTQTNFLSSSVLNIQFTYLV